jgi:hypothetical protein
VTPKRKQESQVTTGSGGQRLRAVEADWGLAGKRSKEAGDVAEAAATLAGVESSAAAGSIAMAAVAVESSANPRKVRVSLRIVVVLSEVAPRGRVFGDPSRRTS